MLDTTQQSFTADVVEASRHTPVLVDFWAPWCGPCRTLSPLLAAAEAEYQGRLKVVKINVDENQELAARFGVRSIPYVVAFVDGEAADSFVGVLPAEALRRFIGRLLPDPAEIERGKAQQLLAAGDADGAARALRAAIAIDPHRDAARMDLAQVLLEHSADDGRLDEAANSLVGVSAAGKLEPRWTALNTQLETSRPTRPTCRRGSTSPTSTLRGATSNPHWNNCWRSSNAIALSATTSVAERCCRCSIWLPSRRLWFRLSGAGFPRC